MRLFALSACGFKQAAQDTVVLQSLIRARALDDLTHDDHGAQTALGLVVGGRDVGPSEASKEVLLLRSQQAFAEGFGFGITQRAAAEGLELAAQGTFLVFGALGTPRFPSQLAMGLAGVVDKTLNVFTEQSGFGIGGFALEQGHLLFQFFGLGFNMGQAGLPILGMDAFVGGIRVSHDGAVEALPQHGLGRFGGTMRIQVEKGQVVIAGIPDPILVPSWRQEVSSACTTGRAWIFWRRSS